MMLAVGSLLVQDDRDLRGLEPLTAFANLRLGQHQPHRFPRRTESRFHLGTDWHPFDMRAKGLGQEGVALVTGVEANRLAEQAGGDTDSRTIVAHGLILCGPRAASRYSQAEIP